MDSCGVKAINPLNTWFDWSILLRRETERMDLVAIRMVFPFAFPAIFLQFSSNASKSKSKAGREISLSSSFESKAIPHISSLIM